MTHDSDQAEIMELNNRVKQLEVEVEWLKRQLTATFAVANQSIQ